MLDKESGRKLVDGDGSCTQRAFRANVLMHWNSLVEERDNDGAGNGDFATSILDEATIFLAAGEERKERKSTRERSRRQLRIRARAASASARKKRRGRRGDTVR
jgi:hypothetical protein